MFKIITRKADGTESRIAISKSYRLVKRTARIKASRDMGAFMGLFLLYENEKLMEQGQIINTRISWEQTLESRDAEKTLQDTAGADTSTA